MKDIKNKIIDSLIKEKVNFFELNKSSLLVNNLNVKINIIENYYYLSFTIKNTIPYENFLELSSQENFNCLYTFKVVKKLQNNQLKVDITSYPKCFITSDELILELENFAENEIKKALNELDYLISQKIKEVDKTITRIITPPDKFIFTKNYKQLKTILDNSLNTIIPNCILIQGKKGCGKRTAISQYLCESKITGFSLVLEGGKSVAELNQDYKALIKTALNFPDSVIIVNSFLADDLLVNDILFSYSSIIRLFKQASEYIPIIFLTNNIGIIPDYNLITERYKFEIEPESNIKKILSTKLQLYTNQVYMPPKESSISNPLYSILMNAKIKNHDKSISTNIHTLNIEKNEDRIIYT